MRQKPPTRWTATRSAPATFAGWSYDAGGKTFTANWAEKTYSVTFSANGGFFNDKSTTSTVEVTQNKYVDLPDAGDVSRRGRLYVLLGWSEKQNRQPAV